ncbi:MAG: histone deacetylase [Geminicoccaceae bacterium]|nr:histone deacetylase [Geminicoccaceae bacterium]
MRPAIVHHPAYVAPLPPGHRFPMPKFGFLFRLLQAQGLAPAERVFTAAPAPRGWLELAHDPAYVSAVLERRLAPEAERRLGLPLNEALVLRGRCAVAGTVLAGRLALEGGIACNMAGGSHHAHEGFGAGFCLFNDVAVAARLLLAEGAVRRVLVVDLDVHQGDGTATILNGDPGVFTLSIHCRTNFPARKAESSLDVPLDPGTGDAAYLNVVQNLLPSLIETQRPDLVFYNAGVDPHERDRLGRLKLTDAGLMARETLVLDACRRSGTPVACVVGGGYGTDPNEVAARHAVLHRAAAALPG